MIVTDDRGAKATSSVVVTVFQPSETVVEQTFDAQTGTEFDTGTGLKVSVPPAPTEGQMKLVVRHDPTPPQPPEGFLALHSAHTISITPQRGSQAQGLAPASGVQGPSNVKLTFEIPADVDPLFAMILEWTDEGWVLASSGEAIDLGGVLSPDGKHISIEVAWDSLLSNTSVSPLTTPGLVYPEWEELQRIRRFTLSSFVWVGERFPPYPLEKHVGKPNLDKQGNQVIEVTLKSRKSLAFGGAWYRITILDTADVLLSPQESIYLLKAGEELKIKLIFPPSGGSITVMADALTAFPAVLLNGVFKLIPCAEVAEQELIDNVLRSIVGEVVGEKEWEGDLFDLFKTYFNAFLSIEAQVLGIPSPCVDELRAAVRTILKPIKTFLEEVGRGTSFKVAFKAAKEAVKEWIEELVMEDLWKLAGLLRKPLAFFPLARDLATQWTTVDSFYRVISIPVSAPPINQRPSADFTFKVSGLTVNFTDTSTDPDNNIVSWFWDFDDGNTSEAQNPTYTYSKADTYDVTLTVTDAEGLSDTVTRTVIVEPTNQPPVADAGPDQTITDTDNDGVESVTLDGSGSYDPDPDGSIVSYIWTKNGTQIATGVNPIVTLPIGMHTITLTVTDDDGAKGTDSVRITITTPQTLTYTLTIRVDGQGTTDPSPGTHTYEEGTQVTITAKQTDSNWVFDRWGGNAGGTDPSITIVMDSDKSITAYFKMLPDPPPSTPTNLKATAVSSSQIDLSWTASTDNVGVAGYKVYRDGVYLESIAGTSYSDTGLNPSTSYCYTVSAYDAAGNESPQSAQACATTQEPPDTTPPTVVSTNPADGSFGAPITDTITATFSEEIQPGTLSVLVIDEEGNQVSIRNVTVRGQTLIISLTSTLAYSTGYGVGIEAGAVKDLAGNPNPAYSWAFITEGIPALPPPNLVSPPDGATVSTMPMLQWKPVDRARGYVIQVAKDSNFVNKVFEKVIRTTSVQVSPALEGGVQYFWRVATMGEGDSISDWSRVWSFTTVNITLTLYVHEGSPDGPVIPGVRVQGRDGAGNPFDKITNSSGYVKITGAPGTWNFTASKDGYQTNTWSQPITRTETRHAWLDRETPKVAGQIIGYKVSPNPASVGKHVTFSVIFRNTGNVPHTFIVGLSVWKLGTPIDTAILNISKEVTLNPNQEQTVQWTHTFTANQTGDWLYQFGLWKAKPFVAENLLDKKPSPAGIITVAKFGIGDTVEVYNVGNIGLRVRKTPCGEPIGRKFDGAIGTILEGPVYCDGYNRWRIRWSDGLVGWSAENWLRRK